MVTHVCCKADGVLGSAPPDKERPRDRTNAPTRSEHKKRLALPFLGVPTAMRATSETTSGAFGLVENWMIPPGFASPYHTHHLEDEAFYVLEGRDGVRLRRDVDDRRSGHVRLRAAQRSLMASRWSATPARMLLLCAPGRFRAVRPELSEPEGAAVAARHGQTRGDRGEIPHRHPGAAAGCTGASLTRALESSAHTMPAHVQRSAGMSRMIGDECRGKRCRSRTTHRRWRH